MTEFDVHLRRGTIRTRRFGPADGKAILCVPGLPGNSRTFDFIGEQLGMGERQVVSFDLRGRGFSPPTGPGTYGWRNEARDVLDLATALEIDTFDLAGHSAGAFVAMQVAVLIPSRVRRLILIDGLGRPQLTAFWEVMRTVQRLGRVYPSAEEYLAEVRGLGVIDPWNDHWERYFRYELKPTMEVLDDGAHVQLTPEKRFHEVVAQLVQPERLPRLTQEMAEVLAIVIMDGMATRRRIEEVRGAARLSIGPQGPVSLPRDSSETLALLLSRGLLCAERDDHANGRPLVYRPTLRLLQLLGTETLEEVRGKMATWPNYSS
ncbi:MAG: alpha/beta hydrolase [Candidatus Dormibacteraeota bacterium]|nr:alpha/beta hydrolase [Candidatus Dormibacteraeota bacterium]